MKPTYRTAAIGAVTVALLFAGAATVVVAVSLTQRHTTGWVATHDVAAGTQLSPDDVHQVTVPQGSDDYAVATDTPTGRRASHRLRSGDLLRPDDILVEAVVDVPVNFKLQPGLQGGDTVDVYGPAGAGHDVSSSAPAGSAAPAAAPSSIQLIGRGVIVVSVGSPSVVRVPASQEQLWVSLSYAGTALIATRSSGVGVDGRIPTSETEALQLLSQLARSAPPPSSGGGAAAPPSAPPAPPPPPAAPPPAAPASLAPPGPTTSPGGAGR